MDAFAELRTTCARYRAGGVILPEVLRVAEQAHASRQRRDRGTVVVATVQGDVHHIGKALLTTILENSGYNVVDAGHQAPIERIVDVALACQAEALALSALLVTSSKQMPLCVQALDRRGIYVPVLIGGAAMNRALGRRANLLPDGREYEPGVFYCRDVFEGLFTLETLRDPSSRAELIERTRSEAGAPTSNADVPRHRTSPSSPRLQRPLDVPRPPFFGARRLEVQVEDVWPYLDLNTLFRHHWGGFPARGADFDRAVHDFFEPELVRLQRSAANERWIEPKVAIGYFTCRSDGDSVIVDERVRFELPRQPDGDRLCLADFFRSDGDVIALQAVTAGPRAAEYVDELQRQGRYVEMLFANGLASAAAEALAELAHAHVRAELGLAADRGLRFSWGYAACPDLEQQHALLPLLDAERLIGLTLTDSANLDPEHSTAAMIVHHPDVTYFAVRAVP